MYEQAIRMRNVVIGCSSTNMSGEDEHVDGAVAVKLVDDRLAGSRRHIAVQNQVRDGTRKLAENSKQVIYKENLEKPFKFVRTAPFFNVFPACHFCSTLSKRISHF